MTDPATPRPTDRLDHLRSRMRDLMPGVRADLEELVRIPSVSLGSFDATQVRRSAEKVAELLTGAGAEVEVVCIEGGHPAVIGKVDGPPGAPTVLLYAHHDVQPPGPDSDWQSSPFEPTERDGRLYARGAADDKAGVLAHVAALRAHDGRPPVSLRFFVEGEEEVGSESLPALLERYADRLSCDAIVIADSANWAVGTPSLTATLRGNVRVVVETRTLDHGLHSGLFGGPVPDAVTAMCRLLATLHTDEGDVAANLLQPTCRAKISMRIAPSQDPQAAYDAIRRHLESHAPWGTKVTVELVDAGAGFTAATDGPVPEAARAALAEAWGVEPNAIGLGASIPFIAEFAQTFPQAAILITGIEDPDTRAHGADESLHLVEFEKACLAEALLLDRLGRLAEND